ncbi:50S ribosomal protein L4, chloroplastic [Panicum miliaceum]|uniref:Large ribosomal subunit protein uL4c n=1 Tax=Panicum miliaceum TaxID=4540 RepID=A0A3L6TJS1_PANMI|nr:50S ribosomal protein L4, chloroplastic [Panicum miliaceum]
MPGAAVASPLLLSLSASSSPFLSSSSTSFLPPTSSAAPHSAGRTKAAVSVLRALRAEAATLPVLSFTGDKVGEVTLDLKSAPPSTARAVVHRAIITDRQNARRGTASTLTRGEVSGGGRKPYQQKKTGKARRGSQRTPLRPGGGVVFGPKPRDWSIKINRKEKRLAISTALASAAVAEDAFVVEEFDEAFASGPKTKDFVAALQRWGLDSKQKAMFFATEFDDNVRLSGRNIGSLKMLTPRTLNLYDILDARKLFFTPAAVDYLNSRYGTSVSDDYDTDDEDDAVEELLEQEVEEEGTTAEAAQAGRFDPATSLADGRRGRKKEERED